MVFRRFIEQYGTYIYRIAYSVLQHDKNAEDVAQEVFAQIYISLPGYRNEGLKTWISRIAVHKSIDFKRKIARQREQLIDSPGELNEGTVPSDDVEHPVLVMERRKQIRERIRMLPPNYREIVEAYYFEEKTYLQIAEEKGMAVKSVESRLYRAKQWMRGKWKEEDFQ